MWVVDNGATIHMTRIYDIFYIIMEMGLGHYIQTNIDSPQVEIRGVGTIRFHLDLGEILEMHRVLFVPRMRVSKASVSSFENEGYGMMVRSVHVFPHWRDEPVGTTIMLGDRRDRLYVLRGQIVHPGTRGWMSEQRVGQEMHLIDM